METVLDSSKKEDDINDVQRDKTKVEGVPHLRTYQDMTGKDVGKNSDTGNDGFDDTIEPVCQSQIPELF